MADLWLVTPYAGVWIEIKIIWNPSKSCDVTPYAGVWIEISIRNIIDVLTTSLPTRECGLKYKYSRCNVIAVSHSLRGSVD